MRLTVEKSTWRSKNAREKLARIEPQSVRRIAVIKHAALGDMLLTRPLFITLRSHFPAAELTLSVIGHYLRGSPKDLVDRIHTMPSGKDKPGLLSSLKAFRELGEQDLLFDITASTRSFFLSRLTKARFKIGYQHRGVHRLIYDVAIPRAAYRYEAETFAEQLHPLGIQFDWPPRFEMGVEPLKRDRPYIVYFPTASNLEKSWPAEHFSELLSQLSIEFPSYDHIILSGLADWEKSIAENIAQSVAQRDNVIQLAAGPNDPGLIKGATVLVSNDTGIRHLGIVLDTTTVGVFFDAVPFGYWPRWGRHQVVYHEDGSKPTSNEVASAVHRAAGVPD